MTIQLVSPDRVEPVLHAIQTTFGIIKPDEFSLLAGGYSSSQTYKILVKDKKFALRVMGFDQVLADREKQIICLQLAADTYLAPVYHYLAILKPIYCRT
jgi:hypothetical protein